MFCGSFLPFTPEFALSSSLEIKFMKHSSKYLIFLIEIFQKFPAWDLGTWGLKNKPHRIFMVCS